MKYFEAGDLDAIARDEALSGARELRAAPLPPAPRLSHKELNAIEYAARMLYRDEKRHAAATLRCIGSCKSAAMGMRDALVLWRLAERGRANGGLTDG
jgi:hypothetical protein